MAKRLKLAKTLPKFASNDEAAEFFETHDISAIWDQLKPVRPFKLPPAQVKMIRERAEQRRKAAISLRLEPEQIAKAKRIARRKSLGYQTQLRLWIAEGIRREAAPPQRS